MSTVGAKGSWKITEVDSGYAQLIKNLFDKSEKPVVNVGIHAKDGAKPHLNSLLTIAEIAAVHEYGLGGMPERSFLRVWMNTYQKQCQEALKRLLLEAMNGKITKYQALEQFGVWMAGQIQQFIAANKVQPPTGQERNERKGSSVTLIDKGALRSSITFSVEGVKNPVEPKPLKVTGFNSKKSKAARKRLAKKAERFVKKTRRFSKKITAKAKRNSKKAVRFGKRTAKQARVKKRITRAQKKGRKKR